MTETWEWVVGYEDRYQVSDQGRIRSWLNRGGGKNLPDEPTVLKSTPNYAGYHVVTLRSEEGHKAQHRLHCLILAAFRGPRPIGHQGAHEDDDKDNNRLSNLAWKPPGENYHDRDRNGGTACGTRHGRYTHGKYVGRSRRYNK